MRKVEATINISCKPEMVIKAFTNNEFLKGWWHVDRAYIDTNINGMYTLTWQVTEHGFGYVTMGNVKTYIPNMQLVIDNFTYLNPEKSILGGMTLTVIAKQNDSQTVLYLCQEGYQQGPDWDWYYQAVKQAWPDVLKSLKRYLEGL